MPKQLQGVGRWKFVRTLKSWHFSECSSGGTSEVALLALALEVGRPLRHHPRGWVSKSKVSQSVGLEVAPPLQDARRVPSATPRRPCQWPGRSGPPRCARGWAGARKVPAPPRLPLPRVKVKVPCRSAEVPGGGGAGAELERAPGTRGAMDGLGRRLRASLRLKRGHGGPSQNNLGEAVTEPERTQDYSLPSFAGGQHFFEYLLVVSLKKKHSGDDYEPTITYQFPKRENLLRGQQEEEERLLKAIPLFCFPDGNEWAPSTEYLRETFSFVLTNVDGSRKIGYCRRLLPAGPGPRLPKVYCIISCIGCFGLFSKILDEVEKRHQISMAIIYPFMQGLREAAFPAPGKTVTLKSFIPDSGTEFISLTRPLDSHLEHVDFSSLLHCLHFEQIIQIFASAVLERKIIFLAEGLSTLSQCIHAAAALLYPFSWAHTYIPVVPKSLLDAVCCPTPFMVGVQMRFLQEVMDSPMEEVLLVNLCEGTFLLSVGDEKDIIPPKLQDDILDSLGQGINERMTSEQVNEHVSSPFVKFFVKTVGHYASYIKWDANGQGHFQERPFCKALTSKTNRRFVKKFVKTQLFSLFIQEAEKSRNPPAGYFQQKIREYEEQKKQKKSREKR